jgi:hypothetical protein
MAQGPTLVQASLQFGCASSGQLGQLPRAAWH